MHFFLPLVALQRIIGVTPAFMRPPYGSYNQMVLDVAGARGQGVVIWDFEYAGFENPKIIDDMSDSDFKFRRLYRSKPRPEQGQLRYHN